MACMHKELGSNTGSPDGGGRLHQLVAREGQTGPYGVAERPVVLEKPSNVGRGKGPQFKVNVNGVRSGRVT